jgi:hypothetical protein
VVVEVVEVLVDDEVVVEVLVDVDVVGGVVVVVGLVVAAASAARTSPLELSPHAESTSSVAQPAAIHCRRMTQSASENQRCNTAAAAC